MFSHPREAIQDIFDNELHVPMSEWICPCGCGGATYYGRDVRALWIVSSLSPDVLIHAFGAETMEELRSFIDRMRQAGNSLRVPTDDLNGLERARVAAFAD